jgi:hypothetical protein
VRNSFVRNPLSVFTLAALTLPALGHADCVPTAPVGYSVPFHMVSLESFRGSSNAPASYSDGQLTYMAPSEFFLDLDQPGKIGVSVNQALRGAGRAESALAPAKRSSSIAAERRTHQGCRVRPVPYIYCFRASRLSSRP